MSSSGAQASITPSLAQGGDDIFAATMPPPKSLVRTGGISMKKRTAR
jgi:hypothetical protein